MKYGTITKSELAQMYGVTTRTLSRWLHERNTALYENLLFVGYYKQKKILTPDELEIIVKYLGTPSKTPKVLAEEDKFA